MLNKISGSVGIGTAASGQALHVVGSAKHQHYFKCPCHQHTKKPKVFGILKIKDFHDIISDTKPDHILSGRLSYNKAGITQIHRICGIENS
jgi:hypothetical protein